MVFCTRCGNKNVDDARYCSKCGNSLNDTKLNDTSLEKQVDDFAGSVEKASKDLGEKIEKAAEKIGREAEEFGKRLEKVTDRTGSSLDTWWDRSFGIFGPLISSFIVLIVIRLVIEFLRIGSGDIVVLGEVSDLLLDYLLLIFVLILFSSYCSYFSRKYKLFQWFTPIFIAVVLVVFFLIVVNIMSIVGNSIGDLEFVNAVIEWREKYMVMIFVIILLVGYLIKVASYAWEKDQKKVNNRG
jgi:hypothetical protein